MIQREAAGEVYLASEAASTEHSRPCSSLSHHEGSRTWPLLSSQGWHRSALSDSASGSICIVGVQHNRPCPEWRKGCMQRLMTFSCIPASEILYFRVLLFAGCGIEAGCSPFTIYSPVLKLQNPKDPRKIYGKETPLRTPLLQSPHSRDLGLLTLT